METDEYCVASDIGIKVGGNLRAMAHFSCRYDANSVGIILAMKVLVSPVTISMIFPNLENIYSMNERK